MSLLEADTLDMSALLIQAYELGDWINSSADMADYLYWKEQLAQDEEAGRLIREFAKKKELFEECERFGHFHPDYHEAMQAVRDFQQKMDDHPIIRNFKRAEERLDELLHAISQTIAHSVSETIKVPGNQLVPSGGCGSGGCGSGGACSGGCG
ncbi:YlbF family regulator [Paenibacillus senegalensis]|uniref:YlbF family regulator n=1 Tax=Paenibacillus senegalensis TaxID=1465766 RepID=UPI0004752187|nr:YlbF family regulator [Paenibacillus senegalensis]